MAASSQRAEVAEFLSKTMGAAVLSVVACRDSGFFRLYAGHCRKQN